MATIAEFKTQYPMYSGMDDTELADKLYDKFYSSMDKDAYYSKIGLKSKIKPEGIMPVNLPEPVAPPAPKIEAAEPMPSATQWPTNRKDQATALAMHKKNISDIYNQFKSIEEPEPPPVATAAGPRATGFTTPLAERIDPQMRERLTSSFDMMKGKSFGERMASYNDPETMVSPPQEAQDVGRAAATAIFTPPAMVMGGLAGLANLWRGPDAAAKEVERYAGAPSRVFATTPGSQIATEVFFKPFTALLEEMPEGWKQIGDYLDFPITPPAEAQTQETVGPTMAGLGNILEAGARGVGAALLTTGFKGGRDFIDTYHSIISSDWFRQLAVPERRLVVLNIDQMRKAGWTEVQIINNIKDPTLRKELKQKLEAARMGGEQVVPPEEAARRAGEEPKKPPPGGGAIDMLKIVIPEEGLQRGAVGSVLERKALPAPEAAKVPEPVATPAATEAKVPETELPPSKEIVEPGAIKEAVEEAIPGSTIDPRGTERVSFLTNYVEKQDAYNRALGTPKDIMVLIEDAKKAWSEKISGELESLEQEKSTTVVPEVDKTAPSWSAKNMEIKKAKAKKVRKSKGVEGVIGYIKQIGGMNLIPDYGELSKAKSGKYKGKKVLGTIGQSPDILRVHKSTGDSPGVVSERLKDEGYIGWETADELVQMISDGKARELFSPERQDELWKQQIKKDEYEHFKGQAADAGFDLDTGKPIDPETGEIIEIDGDIKRGILDAVKAEGLIEDAEHNLAAAERELNEYINGLTEEADRLSQEADIDRVERHANEEGVIPPKAKMPEKIEGGLDIRNLNDAQRKKFFDLVEQGKRKEAEAFVNSITPKGDFANVEIPGASERETFNLAPTEGGEGAGKLSNAPLTRTQNLFDQQAIPGEKGKVEDARPGETRIRRFLDTTDTKKYVDSVREIKSKPYARDYLESWPNEPKGDYEIGSLKKEAVRNWLDTMIERDSATRPVSYGQHLPKEDVVDVQEIDAGADLAPLKERFLNDMVGADPERTVIAELLQNSLDATRENGGDISVKVTADGLEVTDTGAGMSPEIMSDDFVKLAKQGSKGAEDLGGFGLAKLPIMGWPDSFEVTSVAEVPGGGKVRSQVSGTREDYMKRSKVAFKSSIAEAEEDRLPAPNENTPTGTHVVLKKADLKQGNFRSTVQKFISDLRTGQSITYSDDLYPDGKIFRSEKLENAESSYDPIYINFPNLDTEVMIKFTKVDPYGWGGQDTPKGITTKVYNKGLLLPDIPQYSQLSNFKLSRKPNFKIEIDFTKTPSATDSAKYPFLVNRTRLRGEVENKIVSAVQDRLNNLETNIADAAVQSLKKIFNDAPVAGGTKIIIPFDDPELVKSVAKIITDNQEIFDGLGKLFRNFGEILKQKTNIPEHEFVITTFQQVHGFRPRTGLLDKDYIAVNPFSYISSIFGETGLQISTETLQQAATAITDTMFHEAVHTNASGHYGDFTQEWHKLSNQIGHRTLAVLEEQANGFFDLHGRDLAKLTGDIERLQKTGKVADVFSEYTPDEQAIISGQERGAGIHDERIEENRRKSQAVEFQTKKKLEKENHVGDPSINPEDRMTGIKHATIEEERMQRGLEELTKEMSKALDVSFEEGKAIVDSGERDPRIVAQELAKNPRPLTDAEVGMLAYDRMRLTNDEAVVMRQIREARRKGDKTIEQEYVLKLAKIVDDIQNNDKAGWRSTSKMGRAFNALKMMVKEDYSLGRNLLRVEMKMGLDKNGNPKPVPADVEARITAYTDKLQEAADRLAKHQDKQSKKAAQDAITKMANEKVIKEHLGLVSAQREVARARLQKELDGLKKEFNEIYSPTKLSMNIDPSGVKVLVEMAKNKIMQGVTKAEDIVSQIHASLAKDFPDLTERDIRDAISGYGKTIEMSKERLKVEMREAKRQMRLISGLEDAEAGDRPLRSGLQRDLPSDRVRELTKKIQEVMREQGIDTASLRTDEEKWKSALQSFKTRQQHRITDLQKMIDTKDFTKKPKARLVLDQDAMNLRADVKRLQGLIDDEVTKQELANRSNYKKGLDYFKKWRRFLILSSSKVIGKLTEAAISRSFVTSPAENLIAELWLQVPYVKDVMKMSPRYGPGFLTRAEAGVYATYFKRETYKDVWETWLTGQSKLDVLLGDKRDMPPEALDFFGHFHAGLKVPAKNAEFYRYLEYHAQWRMNQGFDLTDPLVQAMTHVQAEGLAYASGNRAILMNKNWVNNMYQSILTNLEKIPIAGSTLSTGAQALLPIVRVPTNFAMEVMEFSFGIPKGLAQVVYYYKKKGGFEELKKDPAKADNIARALTKGGLGVFLFALGYYNDDDVGGYYQPGEKRKPGDVKAGEARIRLPYIGKVEFPTWMLHVPALEVIQMGATFHRVEKYYRQRLKDHEMVAAAIAAAKGPAEHIPFLEEPTRIARALLNPDSASQFAMELATSLTVPPDVTNVARYMDREPRLDRDEGKEDIRRKPKTAADAFKMKVPGLRTQVPRNTKEEERLLVTKYTDAFLQGPLVGKMRKDFYADIDAGKLSQATLTKIDGKVASGNFLEAFMKAKPFEDALVLYQKAKERPEITPDELARLRKIVLEKGNRVADKDSARWKKAAPEFDKAFPPQKKAAGKSWE